MKKFIVSLAVAVLLLGLSGVAMATYTITDDATGGDCTQIGTWDAETKTCTLTTDLLETSDRWLGVIRIDANDITLDGNGHSISGQLDYENSGVYVWGGSGITIKNLAVSGYYYGIIFYYSGNCSVTNSIVTSNYGIVLRDSNNNTISYNNTSGNTQIGINLWLSSSDNTVTGNTASGNQIGVAIGDPANNNIVTNNVVSSNGWGIHIGWSTGNLVSNNTILDNYTGFLVSGMSGNSIYNNNFINNQSAQALDGVGGNIYNLDAPVGGNYWSNYDSSVEGCNDLNNDGFCDAPYYFDGGVDNLPFAIQDGWLDADQDGYLLATDCNDGNPSINPGASEIFNNGIDENCNGMADDEDLDYDGYSAVQDCNDNDATIYPNAPEVKHDGIDQNCNGYDLTIDIITATYKASSDTLTVEATSALGSSANLQLVGYGPMTWKASQMKWAITVKPAGGNPGTVTVSGVEGNETVAVTAN